MDKTILAYLLVMNIMAFAMYGLDKYYAMRDKWRISEKNLLLVAYLGGSIGAYAGMKIFRHKTKHAKFTIGVPLAIVLHIAIAVYVMIG
ncbi:MAG: DUF1294 domain-containing protein [Ruminococcaceae bacterium]|nr:DUF1294 domain-containing protein [Oscillospiraceae bacterium]